MSSPMIPASIQEKMTEQVRKVIFDMLPEDSINSLIEKEFKAYFESPDSPFRVTRIEDRYSSAASINLHASPFRVLVWNEIHTYIKPRLQAILVDENSQLKKSLDEWLKEVAAPTLATDYKAFVHQLSVANSSSVLISITRGASDAISSSINQAMNLNQPYGNTYPTYPVIVPSLNI